MVSCVAIVGSVAGWKALCDPVPTWQAVASCGKLCDPMLSKSAVKLWQIGRKSRKTGTIKLCHC